MGRDYEVIYQLGCVFMRGTYYNSVDAVAAIHAREADGWSVVSGPTRVKEAA